MKRAHSSVMQEKARVEIVERGYYAEKNRKRMYGYHFSI